MRITTCNPADENAILATDRSITGRNPDFIPLRKVDCAGTEDNITQCPRDDTHTCLDSGAGVVCPNGNSTKNLLANNLPKAC